MGIDWHGAFVPDLSILEIILRGSLTYLAIFALLRIVRRQSSDLGISDLLVLVLVADAAQNSMAGNYNSITDGIVLVGTIAFWSLALDWLAFRYSAFERIIHPPALVLVTNGHMLRKNMRRELVTEEELRSQLRQQGIEDLSGIKRASLEADGKISVIAVPERHHEAPETRLH